MKLFCRYFAEGWNKITSNAIAITDRIILLVYSSG
jgi:hypothetical protein